MEGMKEPLFCRILLASDNETIHEKLRDFYWKLLLNVLWFGFFPVWYENVFKEIF